MSHDYRNERGRELVRKIIPDMVEPLKWNGPVESDIWNDPDRIVLCKYCGTRMDPWDDYGNTLIWRCYGIDEYTNEPCMNNPDGKLSKPLLADNIINQGNKDKNIAAWIPRNVI